jgi:transcriptional regulator with XRE-family HTH domain
MTTLTEPDPLDIALGASIRLRRRAARLSQEALAEALDVSLQQVQNYERGTNRVSFSRLVKICRAMDCTIAALVEGLETGLSDRRGLALALLATPGAYGLLTAYAGISATHHRAAVLELARALTRSPAAPTINIQVAP